MDINKFINLRPYLYHLTDRRNLDRILSNRTLSSATELARQFNAPIEILSQKRMNTAHWENNGEFVFIRDQQPISLVVLAGCLEPGVTADMFFNILNERVFFWPTIDRLTRHFDRYVDENPVILRVLTSEIFGINVPPQFSRLNSGATRANSYLGGRAPERGNNTFLEAEAYLFTPSSVAEVTFPSSCQLPEIIEAGYSPVGPWAVI